MNPPATSPESPAFLFAGGGTGGHIYPALAIIEQLRLLNPKSHCELLVSDRSIDHEILQPIAPELDIVFHSLPAKPFGVRPGALARFIPSWGPSVRRSRLAIRLLKRTHPSVVLVAMGGFVAAPAARAGRCERVPVVLVNLDAVPGKANELIARRAGTVLTACDIQGHDGWHRIPPIVRSSGVENHDARKARAAFGLDPDTHTLLITGGSSGAQSINRFVSGVVENEPGALADWQLIHQTGNQISDEELGSIRAIYHQAGVNAWVERYITEMGQAYAAADLGLGRCGAGSVAECWAMNLPSMFFPYPHHKDQHQLHNAKPMIEVGGAIACTDHIDPRTNLDAHAQTLIALLRDADRLGQMREALRTLGDPDGAAQAASILMGIAAEQ